MELSWTGESKDLSSGNSWAVTCEEGDVGDKMVIEVDVTKFRVQPFRSYKVCISLEDSLRDSYLDEVCTHLFSFEKYVPYVPDDEEMDTSVIDDIISGNDMRHATHVKNKESETKEQNKDVKTQLEDIEDFVNDDYKIGFLSIEDRTEPQLSLKILEDLDEFVIEHSSSEKIYFSFVMVLLTGVLIIVR